MKVTHPGIRVADSLHYRLRPCLGVFLGDDTSSIAVRVNFSGPFKACHAGCFACLHGCLPVCRCLVIARCRQVPLEGYQPLGSRWDGARGSGSGEGATLVPADCT